MKLFLAHLWFFLIAILLLWLVFLSPARLAILGFIGFLLAILATVAAAQFLFHHYLG